LYFTFFFNPLSANVVHDRHDADVACSRCSVFKKWPWGDNFLQNGLL